MSKGLGVALAGVDAEVAVQHAGRGGMSPSCLFGVACALPFYCGITMYA